MGMDAPPTIMPRTVRSQVRFIEVAFSMQQNLLFQRQPYFNDLVEGWMKWCR